MLLAISPGHQREFLDCVKSRKKTLTPVEVAHRSQTPGHLGYIASVVGRKLQLGRGQAGDHRRRPGVATALAADAGPWHL